MTDESTVLNNLRTAHYGDWGLDLTSQEVHELWAEIETRDKRVAELEAEVAELKPYRDGYDPKKVFPPEAEWVWMRDCDDNIEPVQYNHIAEIYWNYMPGDCDELYCYWHPNDGDLRRWYPIGKLPEGA